jgi:hypothetical protein
LHLFERILKINIEANDELGFKGELVIEREISGEQQAKDIMASLKFIGGLVDKLS